MEKKELKNKVEKSENTHQNGTILRCINIDCVFNSSNERGAIRNTCNHPNVIVESRFADITIAICSEFRSKKDYAFEKPNTLVDLKSKEHIEIVGKPNLESPSIEKITTKELEEGVSDKKKTKTPVKQTSAATLKPIVIESASPNKEELSPSELYNLTDRPGTDFLILKKLYQPYTKRGLAGSIIFHIFIIFLMYQFLVPSEEKTEGENNQRIVIVEDLEMPKFDPPDIDKIKEEEQKLDAGDNTKDVRPKIIKKNVTPKINRPKDNITPPDTTKPITGDTSKTKFDSSLVSQRDTSRIMIPDSLRSSFDQNDVGLKMWFPKGWKLIDNRQINLTQKEFNGVIISTDSLSEDPGAVNMFVIIDDPEHSAYNKVTYKNSFPMDDSIVVAYVTDPVKSSGKKFSTKYYLFTDPTGKKNILVNVDFASQALMEKYQKLVDAVVRSIKIAEAPKAPGNP